MDPFITELSRQGLGFLLLVIVGVAYVRKDKALSEAYQKRVDDNNRLASVIEATNTASRALEQTSLQRSKIIETIGETTTALAEAVRGVSNSLDQGKLIAESNRQQLIKLSDQVQHMQKCVDRLADEHRSFETKITSRR